MARILIVTYGSLGDLHPAIALASGLRARGHDAALATSEPYRAKVSALGIPFHAVRPDLSLSDEALVRRVMDGAAGSRYLMQKLVFPGVRDMHADLAPLAAQTDLLVTSELVCAAPILGQQTGRPWVYWGLSPISFFPLLDPSVLPGPPGMRAFQTLGPAANRFVLTLAKLVSHHWWRPVRTFRRELGLPSGRSPLFEGKFSPHLNLAVFSPAFQPPQPDWPSRTVQTGFLFHDEDAPGATLPARVREFVDAGDPPIVFTLGSAAVSLARDFYTQSARAAEILGRRAVLLLGRNPPPPDLPPSILAWDYLPYAEIFPHAAAIVHQGGVGTTAQALRAGKPMLVMPFAHDQFDNAARVTRLGVGRELSRRYYAAATAAQKLGELLAGPGIAKTASATGERIRAERGVDRTCAALESALR